MPEAAAPDGSPVDLYALLPERGEGELVARVAAVGSGLLELGCGAGRITRQLLARGFSVTVVDESADMLASVAGAEVVQARIETLELRRRFGTVLLASNLVNVASHDRRQAFLAACARHVAADGIVVVERLPPGWLPNAERAPLAEFVSWIEGAKAGDGLVSGTVVYERGGRRWEHAFSMRPLDDTALETAFAGADLAFERVLDERRSWVVARPLWPSE